MAVGRTALMFAAMALGLASCGDWGQPPPVAATCGTWAAVAPGERMAIADDLVGPAREAAVRRDHRIPDVPRRIVLEHVVASIDKVCEIERRPGLGLRQIVLNLYP